jgi:hypothetical protein
LRVFPPNSILILACMRDLSGVGVPPQVVA